jgi:hypothetical protein
VTDAEEGGGGGGGGGGSVDSVPAHDPSALPPAVQKAVAWDNSRLALDVALFDPLLGQVVVDVLQHLSGVLSVLQRLRPDDREFVVPFSSPVVALDGPGAALGPEGEDLAGATAGARCGSCLLDGGWSSLGQGKGGGGGVQVCCHLLWLLFGPMVCVLPLWEKGCAGCVTVPWGASARVPRWVRHGAWSREQRAGVCLRWRDLPVWLL